MLSKIFCACSIAVICYAQQVAGVYTSAQATAGRAIYQANCAGCHGADLSGQNSASALAGGLFLSSWGDRTPGDLVAFLEGAMPPGNPGSLGEQAYINVTAYILDYQRRAPRKPAIDGRQQGRHSFGGQRTAESDLPRGKLRRGEPSGRPRRSARSSRRPEVWWSPAK